MRVPYISIHLTSLNSLFIHIDDLLVPVVPTILVDRVRLNFTNDVLGTDPPWNRGQGFSCPVCYKCYKHKCSLTLHLRYECSKPPQFACSRCPYRAKRKSHIQSHMALKHQIIPKKGRLDGADGD
uniref:C2H2-type domain-containing protein n=1 Tax=Homalodisca liturata TaxID=320908 RepID=A0A1B6H6A0_9HEMI